MLRGNNESVDIRTYGNPVVLARAMGESHNFGALTWSIYTETVAPKCKNVSAGGIKEAVWKTLALANVPYKGLRDILEMSNYSRPTYLLAGLRPR